MVNPYNLQNYAYRPQYQYGISSPYNYQTPAVAQQVQYNRPVYNANFANTYWQYQNASFVNNSIPINQSFYELSNNMRLGQALINDFNTQYPNLESFTMSELLAKKQERINPDSLLTQLMKNKADRNFETMIECLNKRPEQKDITFDEYIAMIKKEFKDCNMGNCGERAYMLLDKLNKMGLKNHAVIEIGGNKASNSHVFNVIGLAPNAVYNKPQTWGQNAVVVDAWSNKIMKPAEAFNFYHNFFEYGPNNPMTVEHLDITKLFKNN